MEDSPEDLQARIERLRNANEGRKPGGSDGPEVGTALALVLSMGITVAVMLGGSAYLGYRLTLATGNRLWFLPVILLGVLGAGFSVFRMLKPFLK